MTTIKKKRGRPSKLDRAAAIRTARTLFHEKGYDGVGIAELCKALGLKPPSLYAAFESKRNLYSLAIEEYVTNEGDWIVQILGREDDIEEVIEALFLEAANRYTARNAPRGCMVLNGAHRAVDPDICSIAGDHCAATQRFIKTRIRNALTDDADRLADYVMMVLQGLSAGASAGWSRSRAKRAAETAANGFRAEATAVS